MSHSKLCCAAKLCIECACTSCIYGHVETSCRSASRIHVLRNNGKYDLQLKNFRKDMSGRNMYIFTVRVQTCFLGIKMKINLFMKYTVARFKGGNVTNRQDRKKKCCFKYNVQSACVKELFCPLKVTSSSCWMLEWASRKPFSSTCCQPCRVTSALYLASCSAATLPPMRSLPLQEECFCISLWRTWWVEFSWWQIQKKAEPTFI